MCQHLSEPGRCTIESCTATHSAVHCSGCDAGACRDCSAGRGMVRGWAGHSRSKQPSPEHQPTSQKFLSLRPLLFSNLPQFVDSPKRCPQPVVSTHTVVRHVTSETSTSRHPNVGWHRMQALLGSTECLEPSLWPSCFGGMTMVWFCAAVAAVFRCGSALVYFCLRSCRPPWVWPPRPISYRRAAELRSRNPKCRASAAGGNVGYAASQASP